MCPRECINENKLYSSENNGKVLPKTDRKFEMCGGFLCFTTEFIMLVTTTYITGCMSINNHLSFEWYSSNTDTDGKAKYFVPRITNFNIDSSFVSVENFY